MHICFLTSEFPKEGFPHGGVGSFIATLGRELVERGIKVSVVGLNYVSNEETEIINGITVYRLVSKKQKGLQWYYNSKVITNKIDSIHKEHPIDFVEATELGLAFLPKRKEIKYVIRMHGGHHFFAKAENRKIEWWKAFQEKKSFKKADLLVAVSEYVGETTRNLLKLGDVPIQVIYNPVDISKFFDASEIDYVKHTLLFAGSIVEKKGIRQLIESLAFLVDEFPEIHLLIAGKGGNLPGTKIPYLPILEKSITPEISKHITFLGLVNNSKMPNLIAKSNICCYPSHMEAMPLAWLEVLAMGKIFVGSTAGPGNEAVINNVTGILANPYSPEDIADKIKWVLDHPEVSKTMGKNARADVTDRFSVTVIANLNFDFFAKQKNEMF
ncbi:glycosyltransferase family 4 protein [Flavobacterium granuli]|uniref:Glycosyltransferase involved in cell wall biosynthesis n=1 Tax=Flavobacterium granuli TaxID=280093 RepID=A0ABU1S5V9_9FLAO|nr:glycosyltransferase family 4 protein [Flavobacterium granuli]MDR6846429.1 glycosyltransferase involved in cell wall biosynthesis [Flavobacterium granuli]